MADTVGDIAIRITADGSQVKGEMDKIKSEVVQKTQSIDNEVNKSSKKAANNAGQGANDAANNVRKGTENIRNEVSRTSNEIEKGTQTSTQSSNRMGTAFTNAGNKITQAGKGIKKALKTDAALAFAAVGAAATSFAKQCIDSAIASESAWKRFGAIIDQQGGNWAEQEKGVKTWARTFSNNMGYAVSDTREASLNLLQFGMDAKNLEPAMRGVAGLAARTGMSEAEASKVVISAMAGRGTQLKKLTGLSVDAYNKCQTEADQLRLLSDLYKQNEVALREHGETTEAQLTRVDNSWGMLKTSIGQSLMPVIKAIADILWVVAEAFNNLPGPVKTFMSVLLLIGGAIGVVLGVVGMLAPGIIAVGEAVGGLSGLIAFLTGPIGLAIAAIVAFVAILYYLYNTNEDVRKSLNAFAMWLQSSFAFAWQSLEPVVSGMVTWLTDVAQTAQNMLMPTFQEIVSSLAPLGQVFGELVTAIQRWWSAVTGGDAGQAASQFNLLATVGGVLKFVILTLAQLFAGELKVAVMAIVLVIQSLVQGFTWLINLSTSFYTAIMGIVTFFSTLGTTLQTVFAQIRLQAGLFVGMIVNTIVSRFMGMVNGVRMAFQWVVTTIRLRLAQARQIAMLLAQMIRQAIVTRFNLIVARVRAIFQNIVNTIRQRLANAVSSARQKALEIYNGIKNKVAEIPQAVADEFNKIKDKISSALDNAKNVAVSKISDLVAAVKGALGIASPGYIQRMMTWEFNSLSGVIELGGKSAIDSATRVATGIVKTWDKNMVSLGVQFDAFNPARMVDATLPDMRVVGTNLTSMGEGVVASTQYTNSTRNEDNSTVYNIDNVTFNTEEAGINGKQMFYDVLDELTRTRV